MLKNQSRVTILLYGKRDYFLIFHACRVNTKHSLFSAVPTQYNSTTISAWGGPGYGTVSMSAYDFQTYLPTPNHPGAFNDILAFYQGPFGLNYFFWNLVLNLFIFNLQTRVPANKTYSIFSSEKSQSLKKSAEYN